MISKELISTMNKIHDVCVKTNTLTNFDLPQLVVIGSQSVGKSSVLENIVGRDFLPRGTGIVTRCPLKINLIREENGSKGKNIEYGVFGHKPHEKIFDFAKIRTEIEKQTAYLAGTEEGVSNEEIMLSIYSPNVIDLTLVDLPGVISIAYKSPDIVAKIKEMNLKFISNENSLILAVSPADSNLHNSDALALAREVDKNGVRTIGVITKLDKASSNEDVEYVRQIMEGELFPLRRAYIGVINRSHDDTKTKKSIEDALKFEEEYIKAHYYYKTIAERLGIPYLRRVLSEQLTEHIRKNLPKLQRKWREEMTALQQDILKYEELHPQDPAEQRKIILMNIQRLQNEFEHEIGSARIISKTLPDQTTCGCKIKSIFFETFPNEMSKVVYKDEELENEIRLTIKTYLGINTGLGEVPFKVFERVVQNQVDKLTPSVTNAINLVIELLSEAVPKCTQHLKKYPELHHVVTKHIMEFIDTNGVSFQANVLSLLRMETAYINTTHEEFVKNLTHNGMNGDSNRIIRSGNLNIEMINGKRHVYLVTLNSTTLKCMRRTFTVRDSNGDLKAMVELSLNGLQIDVDTESNIVLYRLNGANVFDNYEKLNFICPTHEFKSWTESFSTAIRNANNDISTEEVIPDVVQATFKYSDSYMKIVTKTIRDMIPKAITLYIVKELDTFIREDLVNKILPHSKDGYAPLLGVDSNEVTKYEANKRMFETLKEMLQQIRI